MADRVSKILAPKLFAPIPWWVEAVKGDVVRVSTGCRWEKRDKSTHRYEIADTRGRLQLTVPVGKPDSLSNALYRDIRLSGHGQWWHVHRVSLESAYGRTPYFEHLYPALSQYFEPDTIERIPLLADYMIGTTSAVVRLLGMESEVVGVDDRAEAADQIDLSLPYYQVRGGKLGFVEGLSILDLLFNLGPEALLYLRRLAGLNPDGTPC